MSFFAKGDFKTREEWLKRQRKQLMKRESLKYHQYNSKNGQQKNTVKPTHVQEKQTLAHILKTDDTEQTHHNQIVEEVGEKLVREIKNEKDRELYASMRDRLQQQERVLSSQRTEIHIKQSQIQELRSQNFTLRGLNSDAQPLFHKRQELQQQKASLLERFAEMQKYLNQHGVRWVSGQLQGQIDIKQIKEDIKKAKTQYRMPTHFQFETLAQRIEELNESLIAEFGSQRFVMVGAVHQLAQLQQIQLLFYSNGLLFQTVGFYSYDAKEGLRILTDLTDGYYPHVLKQKYPQGVLMKVVNSLSLPHTTAIKESSGSGSPYFMGQAVSLQ